MHSAHELLRTKNERHKNQRSQGSKSEDVQVTARHVHSILSGSGCTAICTKGESAFSLVMSMMSEEMRRTHGVFALCGMPKDIADASFDGLR